MKKTIALLAPLLLFACSAKAPDIEGTPTSPSDVTSSPVVVATTSSPSAPSEMSKPPSEPSNEEDPKPSESISFPVRALNADELAELEAGFGSENRVFTEHCFVLESGPMAGSQFLAASLEGRQLGFRWRNGDKITLLPQNETPGWTLHRLDAVAFGDYDKDGHGPDVLALAQYLTGIAPEGAKPFPVALLYLSDENSQYKLNKTLSEKLTEKGVTSISAAEQALSEI